MKRQKWLMGILAVMLAASFLLAVVSFVAPMDAQAAPPQPEGCPPECNLVAQCFDCCMWEPGVGWMCCDYWLTKCDCINSACEGYTAYHCTYDRLWDCPVP